MEIVNFDYYEDEDKFSGTLITDEDEFNKYLKVARAYLNRLTFNRIVSQDRSYGMIVRNEFVAFSTDELAMFKNGLCELTEAVYKLKKAETQALAGSTTDENIKSRTSGGESISYDKSNTAYDDALSDTRAKNTLFKNALMTWIVPDAFQYNPFFAGSR